MTLESKVKVTYTWILGWLIRQTPLAVFGGGCSLNWQNDFCVNYNKSKVKATYSLKYLSQKNLANTGLEKSTRPLVFTSASGCRASGILDDFQCKLIFIHICQ